MNIDLSVKEIALLTMSVAIALTVDDPRVPLTTEIKQDMIKLGERLAYNSGAMTDN